MKKFMMIALDATGQLFYSLSIAMGIMVTYGSYMRKEDNLVKNVNQVEIFDTGVALLAGLMVPLIVALLPSTDTTSKTRPTLETWS